MHRPSTEKHFSTLWRRVHHGYELHFRRLFIADFFALLFWLGRCTYEGISFFGRGMTSSTRWSFGVSARILMFIGHTSLFVLHHTVGRGLRGVRGLFHAIGNVSFAFTHFLGRMAIGAIHVVLIRPFLRLAGRAHYTGDTTVNFVTSFHPFHPPVGWQRTLVSFVVMVIVFIIPFPAIQSLRAMETVKEETVKEAMNGIDAFSKGQEALLNKDTTKARAYFTESYERFLDAEGSLVSIPPFLFDIAGYLPGMGKEASEGKKLLQAGKELSLAGQYMTTAFDPLLDIDGLTSRSLLALSDTVDDSLSQALPHLEKASALIETIDASILPTHQQELLIKAQHQLPMVLSMAQGTGDALSLLHNSLGADQKKRYLVVLQNHTEIRATGGFIGSFALIDIDRGVISNIDIPPGGSYDLQGSLSEHVISPAPLHLVNPSWQFQDANWFPDFPTSAQKLQWFYEKSGGSSLDGVIAINAGLGADILKLTGPIPMPGYEKTIDSDNFLLEIQKSVEIEYDRAENKPKKFIADLIPQVMMRLATTSNQDYSALVQVLVHALTVNDVQVYLTNESDQARLRQLGLGGHVKTSPRDYTMIVDSNIAGGKTDGLINTKAHELIVMNPDESIDVTLRLWRQHTGVKGMLFTGVNNVNYMRVYIPAGSTLLSAQGFNPPDRSLFKNPSPQHTPDADLMAIQGAVRYDPAGMYVNNELNKTVLGNWVQTAPGQTSLIEIKYRLPFTVKDLQTSSKEYGYMHLLQRQSASLVKEYSVDIVIPPSYTMKWHYPTEMTNTNNTWHWKSPSFDKDALIAFQFIKQ